MHHPNNIMQKVFVIVVYSFIIAVSHAQPYFDIASIGSANSQHAAVWPRTDTRNNLWYYVGCERCMREILLYQHDEQ